MVTGESAWGDVFATAISKHQRGELAAAEMLYQQVLQANPRHAGAMHYLGVIAYQRGRCAGAVEWIERAIAVDRGQAAFHNNLGLALKGLGRTAEAKAAYERVLELRPANETDRHYSYCPPAVATVYGRPRFEDFGETRR